MPYTINDIDMRRKARGEGHPQAKLTAEDVRLIRVAYESGGITQKALAEKFSVSLRAIQQVLHFISWRHVF
jgi:predicted DNA binding protein